MSVHELKRPPTADASAPKDRLQLSGALEQLRHWAQARPLHNALRHKRQGHWYAWRWIDALRAVERLADGVLVTDDNPRTEDPAQIFDDIRAGFSAAHKVEFIAGRGPAIARLIASASADDVVVLAGKGHEDYQEINGQRHGFSDLAEADKALIAWEAAHA